MINKFLMHVALPPMDIPQQALSLVQQYGPQAPTVAARKALALVATGNRKGYAEWMGILNDVNVLLDQQPDDAAQGAVDFFSAST